MIMRCLGDSLHLIHCTMIPFLDIVLDSHLCSYVQESSEFHKRSFECAVDSIRAIAASHLWQVLNMTTLLLPC